MLSAVIGAFAIGILLGLFLRVPAAMLASAAIALAGAAAVWVTHVGILMATETTLAAVFALQCGYILGLALSCVWWRVRGFPPTPATRFSPQPTDEQKVVSPSGQSAAASRNPSDLD